MQDIKQGEADLDGWIHAPSFNMAGYLKVTGNHGCILEAGS